MIDYQIFNQNVGQNIPDDKKQNINKYEDISCNFMYFSSIE